MAASDESGIPMRDLKCYPHSWTHPMHSHQVDGMQGTSLTPHLNHSDQSGRQAPAPATAVQHTHIAILTFILSPFFQHKGSKAAWESPTLDTRKHTITQFESRDWHAASPSSLAW